jgi:hypothetical protein
MEPTLPGQIDAVPVSEDDVFSIQETTWIMFRIDSELIILSQPEFWSSRKTRDESVLQGQCLTRLSHEAELTHHLFIIG